MAVARADVVQVGDWCDTCAASPLFSVGVLRHVLLSTVNFRLSWDDEQVSALFLLLSLLLLSAAPRTSPSVSYILQQ